MTVPRHHPASGHYDAFLFDNDGVLMDCSGVGADEYVATMREVLESHGIPADDIDPTRLLGGEDIGDMRELCAAHGVAFESFRATKRAAETRLEIDRLDAGVLQPFDDIDALRRMPRDFPFAIVTNGDPAVIRHAIETGRLPDVFDTVHGCGPSAKGGERLKPSPALIAEARTSLDAASPLVIGDSATDVMAAKRAGVDIAYLDRTGEAPPPATPAPDLLIESLAPLHRFADTG